MERKCWLLTWNQARWAWDEKLDGYKEMIKEIEQVGKAFSKWICGVNKSIKAGDRIFMIKLGSEPRGIIASGIAITDVFEGTHWDSRKMLLERKQEEFIYSLIKSWIMKQMQFFLMMSWSIWHQIIIGLLSHQE